MIRQVTIESPIGRLLLAQDDEGVCRLRPALPDEDMQAEEKTPLLEQAKRELDEYFEGKRRAFDFPISMHGTAFERAVWRALLEIPYGEVCSYGQLAARLGRMKGARAVGGACARNPLLIVVPCHRVIAASGALTGFAAGMQTKRSLLALEGHTIASDRLSIK